MSVVTRFAPSPTGALHIGGVRTAIFNWLYARHHKGRFLLRIEDTDKARSSPEAVAAILNGLAWMKLDADEAPLSQASRLSRHQEIAQQLLAQQRAYRCFATPDELTAMRAEQKDKGLPQRYDGRWRDRDPSEAPSGIDPVIRLRSPQAGSTRIDDAVQGEVQVDHAQLDDLVILRSDQSPTYHLAVVVDDHDMGVSHVIRGDDHLNNAFRQTAIYQALDWDAPIFAHIPLIHGADGAKLSKRHAAVGIDSYQSEGFLSEALFSYLLRLGWSHGNAEIISRQEAIDWFDLSAINRAAARFDGDKLKAVNAHYLRRLSPAGLVQAMQPFLPQPLNRAQDARLRRAAPAIMTRAQTLKEASAVADFYLATPPLRLEPKAAQALEAAGPDRLRDIHRQLAAIERWEAPEIEQALKTLAAEQGVKIGQIFMPLRAALSGSMQSPGVVELAFAFGRDKTLAHLAALIDG